jgi:hypothetical protein
MMTRHLKLNADAGARSGLTRGITHFAVIKHPYVAGPTCVLLKQENSSFIEVVVTGATIVPRFEVFTLTVSVGRLAELGDQSEWQVWPFSLWHVCVATREEFIVPIARTPAMLGSGPSNAQDAVKPGCVPRDAIASAEVDAALLFFGGCGRLLIGVDWMPLNLIVTQDEHVITDYLRCCELAPPLTEFLT